MLMHATGQSLLLNGIYIKLYIHVTVQRNRFFLNKQTGALIIKIYSVIKLCIFRTSPLPIIRSFPLYIRQL